MSDSIKRRSRKPKQVLVNLSYTNYPAIRTCVEEMGYVITESCRKNVLFWCDQAATSDFITTLQPWQLYNHFPGMWAIARKADMIRNLESMQRLSPGSYDFYPRSFILPGNYQDLRSYWTRANQIKQRKRTFVIKPDRGSLGRGILLIQDPESISSYSELAIAQKYISPFLVDNLKFDLRIYALITSIDPLRIYIHREGMARFCTEPYEEPNSTNLDNLFAHLTNYSLNKKNENFTADHEHSHKRPMSAIFAEIAKRGFDAQKLQNQIDEILRLTIAAIQPFLANNYRSVVPTNDGKSRCFELLGFDILIDKRARPWLLEVNFMPMLDIDTNFDKELKFSVIKGIFTIIGLSPGFKSAVLKRQKADSDRRINGTTSMPICEMFDPEIESKTAAEFTNWRQLYPLPKGVESAIENALVQARTLVVASIENEAFRVRQKAVMMQIQEMNKRDAEVSRVPTIAKIVVPPMICPRKPPRPIVVMEPVRKGSVPKPDEVLVAIEAFPVGQVKTTASVCLPGFAPIFIDREEENARIHRVAAQAMAARAAGLDRVLAGMYKIKPRAGSVPPLAKIKQSRVAVPFVRPVVSVHQIW
jgi:tubulin polyglutamylase TTLL6/13